jgi:CBS domain-containing protein
MLRNLTPFQVEETKYTTRGKLTAEQLTKEMRLLLKQCLRTGVYLQKYVAKSVEAHREKEKG